MKRFYIQPMQVRMAAPDPSKYHGHVISIPFDSLDEAMNYWLKQLHQYESDEIDKMRAYIKTLFDPRPGYYGHPECYEAPNLSIVVEERRKHWKSLMFCEIEESLMDTLHVNDTDPVECHQCGWPYVWTHSLSDDAVKFISPFELDYKDKPDFTQLQQQVRDYLRLARDVERFWERNEGYFKKIRWYKNRNERPPFKPLPNPFSNN